MDVVKPCRFVLQPSVALPGHSVAAPALTSGRDELFLAWTAGARGRLHLVRSGDGRAFAGHEALPHRSWGRMVRGHVARDLGPRNAVVPLGPALAATARGLHLGWRGSDGHVNVARRDENGWSHVVLDEHTRVPPALAPAADGDELLVVWTGTDRHLNDMETRGGAFVAGHRWAQTSRGAPAAATSDGRVILAWMESFGGVRLAAGPLGEPTPPALLGDIRDRPALCVLGDDVILAWTDANRRVERTGPEPGRRAAGRDLPFPPQSLWTRADRAPGPRAPGLDRLDGTAPRGPPRPRPLS